MKLFLCVSFRSRLPEFPAFSGCCCVHRSISHLPSDFPQLDDCSTPAHRLHVGPPHPVHRTYAAVRETLGTSTSSQKQRQAGKFSWGLVGNSRWMTFRSLSLYTYGCHGFILQNAGCFNPYSLTWVSSYKPEHPIVLADSLLLHYLELVMMMRTSLLFVFWVILLALTSLYCSMWYWLKRLHLSTVLMTMMLRRPTKPNPLLLIDPRLCSLSPRPLTSLQFQPSRDQHPPPPPLHSCFFSPMASHIFHSIPPLCPSCKC